MNYYEEAMTLLSSMGGRSMTKSRMLAVAVSVLSSLSISNSQAVCTKKGEGFFPKNNLSFPVNAFRVGGLTEKDFNDVIDKVSAVYAPIIAQRGGKLEVERNWKDRTVNAYAERSGDIYKVAMFGGLARHPLVTNDGFALVLCHEIGHHLGGAPKYPDLLPEGVYMADEGQADYFGNLKCMRRVTEKDDNAKIVAALKVPKLVENTCVKSFPNANDALICQRSAMAGFSLASLLADISKSANASFKKPSKKMPKFDTPDSSIVSTTYDGHPEAQCRLDTYYAAAICTKEVNDELSETDATVGACSTDKGDKVGVRPLCWFNPKNYNSGT